MVLELFKWWYTAGWAQMARSPNQWINGVGRSFSLPILARTLFAPWKRITSISGRSIDAKIRASVDNFVSRLVGFTTRLLVLIAAGVMILLSGIFGAVLAVIWPFIPVLIIFCLVKAVIG